MATLKKITIIRWVNADGTRAAAHAPGAKKEREQSAKWYLVEKVNGKIVRTPLATDKGVSRELLKEHEARRLRGEAGVFDHRGEMKRPITDHLAAYLKTLRAESRSKDHQREVERVCKNVVASCGWATLADVTANAITDHLSGRDVSAVTKNKHRVYLSGFFSSLVPKKLPTNPITDVPTFHDNHDDDDQEQPRDRRDLSPEELKRLFAAAAEYHVKARTVHRGGRPRRDGTPAQPRRPVNLKPETLAKLIHEGEERRLLYILAVFTGLRRGELSRLRVRHCDFGRFVIDMPGKLLKNGRRGVIPLVVPLAELLRKWTADKHLNDFVVSVPTKKNLSESHKKILELASIAYQDAAGKYADFHSMRTTVNTYLHGQNVRHDRCELFMRHRPIDINTASYISSRDMDDIVDPLTRLWAYCF